ncbi:MAG: MurR/RpiR family transcriptional regulator, partial [Chloroflexota bacterium]|nr:MurR/RpiR family transcriptional regulator [Chloroflexota bacterium]
MLPDSDVLARLAAAQPSLTPKMARLAAFVADNYVQVAFMSTRELAAAAEVSPATVVRFPMLLGYRSFDDLRASIQDRVNFDLTGVARLQQSAQGNRSPAALLRRIIDADSDSLRALAQTFSEPQVERFAGALLTAERVTIIGFRYVGPLTLFFEYSLAKIKDNVRAYTRADSSLVDEIRLMGAGDVVIVIAFARYPADLVALARYAHRCGVRLLAITDSPLSPVLPLAEVALFARVSMLDFVGSLAAPAALINCIVSDLGVRLGEQAVARLHALEDAASEAGIYV